MTTEAQRAYLKKWKAVNKEKVRAYNRKGKARQRAAKRDSVSLFRKWTDQVKMQRGCEFVLPDGSICGWREHPAALDFNHRDPSQKKAAVSRMHSASRQAKEDEVAKCEVLCANHHRMVTMAEGHVTLRRRAPVVEIVSQPSLFGATA